MPMDSELQSVHAPQDGKKYFTLEEANRAITYVAPIVEDVRTTYREAVEVKERLTSPEPQDDSDAMRVDYERTVERLNHFLDELQQAGVELKDYESGLLDFPAVMEEREVYLCWKLGEERILAWHEIETGFAGRQDITSFEAGDVPEDN